MHFNLIVKLSPLLLSLAYSIAAAHEDLDIGIADVSFDKQCYAHVQLVNKGRDLPESFYLTVNPAFFSIDKGEKREQGRSLRALDKSKQLQKEGGQLTVRSRTRFANIPSPMKIELHFLGEFLDYGAANNTLHKSIDCVPGRGQVAGDKIIPTAPDIAITHARIDPSQCQLEVTFTNLTNVPLTDEAWQDSDGAQLVITALDTHELQPPIALVTLDPEQHFTRTTPVLEWHSALPNRLVSRWRVGLWYVKGDNDFSNNQIDLAVPDGCRSAP